MIVYTIFSLFNVNQKGGNGLFIQVPCASTPTNGILIFYNGISCPKVNVTFMFRCCFSL